MTWAVVGALIWCAAAVAVGLLVGRAIALGDRTPPAPPPTHREE